MRRALPLLLVALAGCASNASPGATPVSRGPVVLAPGQQVALPRGGFLRYVETVNDSRCRPGQQCVWAGEATVLLDLSPSGVATQRVELKTGAQAPQAVFKELAIRLVSLSFDAPPKATLEVEAR